MTTTPTVSTLTAQSAAHTRHIVGAWALLMAFTLCTWRLGASHGVLGLGRQVSMVSILVLTFAKVYVVGHSFMELRQSARWLVLTFTTWCIGLCAALSLMYLSI
jgi:Prokaryotic Cytochrome C oxidase subunit IV